MIEVDVAIVGGGIIGATAAAAVAQQRGIASVHVAPPPPPDARTTALLQDAVGLLRELGVWDRCEAAPLRTMRLVDGSRRLLRARPIDFRASEIGLEAFGYNVGNGTLLGALGEIDVDRRATFVDDAVRRDGLWRLRLSDGKDVVAPVVVAADGRNSPMRAAAGIAVRRWSYDQTALVVAFEHELPHGDVSTEFHTETGPFTQVPLPPTDDAPHRSSLVWVVRRGEAERLMATDLNALGDMVADGMEHMLGGVRLEAAPMSYPLEGSVAEPCGRDGVLLVGEAAHVMAPIGAQGANLGFRDIAAVLEGLRGGERDPDRLARAYAANRRADVALRTGAVDALNRSLLTSFLPVQIGRALGTGLLARSGALRRAIMRFGMAPRGAYGNGSTGSEPVVIR